MAATAPYICELEEQRPSYDWANQVERHSLPGKWHVGYVDSSEPSIVDLILHATPRIQILSAGSAIDITTQKLSSIPPLSSELKAAIEAAHKILKIEVDPEAGIDVPYAEDTLRRAVDIVETLANIFWQDNPGSLPAPIFGPAVHGSIDLFWERDDDVSLLINVPGDNSAEPTFYGRRSGGSTISGTLARVDKDPRHLTGWLANKVG